MQRLRFQQVLESTMFRSIARLLERNNTRHLGPAGGRSPTHASTGSFPTSCRLTGFSSTKQWAMMGDPLAAYFVTGCPALVALS